VRTKEVEVDRMPRAAREPSLRVVRLVFGSTTSAQSEPAEPAEPAAGDTPSPVEHVCVVICLPRPRTPEPEPPWAA
jgi:hypothetical protein